MCVEIEGPRLSSYFVLCPIGLDIEDNLFAVFLLRVSTLRPMSQEVARRYPKSMSKHR